MELWGELSALITAFCWSGSSFAFGAASRRIGSFQLNVNRMILAAIILLLTILIMNFNYVLSLSQIVYLAISGMIGLVFGDTFLFKAYQHIGARISMLMMSLSPAISTILAYFFLDEYLTFLGIVGIIITLSGIMLVVLERGETPSAKYKISKIGILYGALGALGQAVGLIFAKFAFQAGEINGFVATFIRIITAVIIMLPIGILAKRYKNPFKLFANDLKAFGQTMTGTILGPYLGITFSLLAIEYAKIGIAATIMATVPIIMLPIAKYLFREEISWRAVIGAIMAVGGVAILFLR